MSTPYIGFGNDKLNKLPKVQVGSLVQCTHCGKDHPLEPCDDGSTLLMFYRCGGETYLGAVDGRLTAGIKPDVSGNI